MQLRLQIELAEENHNHFTHRSHHRSNQNKCASRNEKIITLNGIKNFVRRPEIGPKHFDKLKAGPNPARLVKPGPAYNSATADAAVTSKIYSICSILELSERIFCDGVEMKYTSP